MTMVGAIQSDFLTRCHQAHVQRRGQLTIACLFLLKSYIEDATFNPLVEDLDRYDARLRKASEFYTILYDVVGRLQERLQPGDDPGDDESRPSGEDE
jgi:hypothetical protein